MSTIQGIKQRFGIIGGAPALDRAIDIAMQVAPTDLSVLITGESGSGKEVMPQIIHQESARKHAPYIAVNCGAIPEGTIDSELFGHEKGSFTGATGERKGYFEEANGGTIFLDEVAELPIQTQVRLLRVLETGEFIKVGSSKVQKTDIRVVAATNVDIPAAIQKGKFREDLYYRLNTVPIGVPALRERKEDIHLLFRKFAADFAEKYRMPQIKLSDDAVALLTGYRWPGNVRQLRNVTEQLCVIEENRDINADILRKYLPDQVGTNLPVLAGHGQADLSDREILYKVLFDMKNDMTELKRLVLDLLDGGGFEDLSQGQKAAIITKLSEPAAAPVQFGETTITHPHTDHDIEMPIQEVEEVEESLSLEDKEIELIRKALEKHRGKRKYAAQELGISERTLYRKIKEHGLTEKFK